MRCVPGDVRHFTGVKGAFLTVDPLVGDAFEYVDDFFAAGMGVEFVGLAGLKGGADEEDIFGADDFGIGHPLDMAPGHVAVLEVFGGDEVGGHEAGLCREKSEGKRKIPTGTLENLPRCAGSHQEMGEKGRIAHKATKAPRMQTDT